MRTARDTYHHGDLRAALVRTGLEMSRELGAEGIVLREATRRVGVTARAAYRHFADRDALVRAVAQAALVTMAGTIAARQEGASGGAELFLGVGEGYIQFALDEPGWFDVAFFAMDDMLVPRARNQPGQPGPRLPYEQLEDALRVVVDQGDLAADRVPDAVLTCWSAVHGFATLTSRGPMRELDRATADAEAHRLCTELVRAFARRATSEPPQP